MADPGLARQQAADPVEIACGRRTVESQLGAQRRERVGLGLDAKDQERGIARQDLQDHKDREARDQQGDEQDERPADEKGQHGRRPGPDPTPSARR